MRKLLTFSCTLLLAACTYDPNDKGDEMSFHPQVLSRPVWTIGKQGENGAARFCQVTAGELNVALQSDGQGFRQQVNISDELLTGENYKVMIGSHRYETQQSWFSDADSAAMIQDLLSNQGFAYTELFSMRAANHDMRANNSSNKIPLSGFAGQYQACKSYVQPHR